MTGDRDDVADILARRLSSTGPRGTGTGGNGGDSDRWEDRHVRWTVWVERDLRAQIETMRLARDMSVRELVDELLRAGLEQSTGGRPPGRRRRLPGP